MTELANFWFYCPVNFSCPGITFHISYDTSLNLFLCPGSVVAAGNQFLQPISASITLCLLLVSQFICLLPET